MTKRMLLAVMALAGVGIATYLTLYKVGIIGTLACTIGSCETVNVSKWSVFLGLPVAAWGLAYYVVVFLVAMVSNQERWLGVMSISKVMFALLTWGVLFSAWLTWLELYVIHAICMWCVISAVLVTVMWGVSFLELRAVQRETNAPAS